MFDSATEFERCWFFVRGGYWGQEYSTVNITFLSTSQVADMLHVSAKILFMKGINYGRYKGLVMKHKMLVVKEIYWWDFRLFGQRVYIMLINSTLVLVHSWKNKRENWLSVCGHKNQEKEDNCWSLISSL